MKEDVLESTVRRVGEIKLLAASVPSLWHLAQVCQVDVLQSTVNYRLQVCQVCQVDVRRRDVRRKIKLEAASVPALEK